MLPRHSQYDTIIVGARCAGAATAMLLARSGRRVLAIDRGAPDDDALSTHALMRPAVVLLHHWGVLDDVIAAATPAVRSAHFHYGEQVVSVDIKPRDGVDALYAPRRTVLDPVLVAAARRHGAEVHHHVRLLDVDRDGAGRVHGVVLRAGDAVTHVRADLVIGADGLGSALARAVAAPIVHAGEHATATIYAHVEGFAADGYHWYFNPGVAAGVIPTNRGACVFANAPSARFRADLHHDPRAWFHRVLAAAAPEVASRLASSAFSLRAFGGRPGYLRRASGPGWALVGDAGFFRDPLTAHGITDALRDAALLARELAGGGALARYEDLRDEYALPILRVTDAIASFDWDLTSVAELHRRLNQEIARELELVRSLASGERPARAA